MAKTKINANKSNNNNNSNNNKNTRSKMKLQLQQKLLLSKSKQQNVVAAAQQLVNVNVDVNVDKMVECDPTTTTTTTSSAADVGVLSSSSSSSCGETYYCMESMDSSLGGYCVPSSSAAEAAAAHDENDDDEQQQGRQLFQQRNLQEIVPINEEVTTAEDDDDGDGALIDYLEYICNATVPEDAVTELGVCDCTDIDADLYVGKAICTSESQSYSFETICGNQLPNVTFNYQVQYTLDVLGVETGTAQVCYQLTEPSTIEYCYTYSVSPNDEPSCTMSLNGVDCNTCTLFSQNATNPSTGELYTLECHEFDCTNTEFPVEGSLCDDSTLSSYIFTDILVYGYLPCPDACFLCGSEGLYTSTPTAPFLGDNNTCGLVELAALAGYPVVAQYCTDISTDFQASCSCTSVRYVTLCFFFRFFFFFLEF